MSCFGPTQSWCGEPAQEYHIDIVQTPTTQEHGASAMMKMMIRKLLVTLVAGALLAPLFADARDWRPGMGVQAQGQPARKGGGQFQRGGQDKRDGRDKRDGHDQRDKSKLTEEERRDLHKDLDRANREIYRR